ncbi:MAG: hypothetical protein ACOC6D_05555 [Atribacterota bacterium]
MVVKKNEKKRYYLLGDDIHSIKDLIEDKRKEIRELEMHLRSLPKVDLTDNEEESERGGVKRQIKRLEKEIKVLQRKL